MKKIHLLLLACFITGSVSAQTDTSKPLKFGINAGLNFASFGFDSETKKDFDDDNVKNKAVTTFHLGGFADYTLNKGLSVRAGLTLSGMGGKQTYEEKETDYSYSETQTRNIMYLQVPVSFIYSVGDIYFGAGPYFGFALSGKSKSKWDENDDGDTDSGTDEEDLKFGSDNNADLKGSDFGININAGYKLKNGVSLGLGYGLGLSNLVPKPSGKESVKNKAFSISVGYSF